MAVRAPKTYLQEVILENFMSYEYARIPFKRGLNLICGPNGAGKSAILVAISVAMGQSYTERARKLRDLIRHGKKAARVTLLFDNAPVDGIRPFPFSRSDSVALSRYLKDDGTYWYEMDYKQVPKSRVERIFKGIGLNPDNMLVIMHQNMIEQFGIISPEERLQLVEEAVGFQDYRRKVLEAQEKLNRLVGEEEAVANLLKSAEQTLAYWKEQYEKLKLKRELRSRKVMLEREEIWARIIKHERDIEELKERIKRMEATLESLARRISERRLAHESLSRRLEQERFRYRGLFYDLISIERQMAQLEASGEKGEGPKVRQEMRKLQRAKAKIEGQITESEKEISKLFDEVVDVKVDEAVSRYRRGLLEKEIRHLNKRLSEEEEGLRQLEPERARAGARIETKRTPSEVLEELKYVSAQLATLAEVPEEAEEVYNHHLEIYSKLSDRIKEVSENRRRALEDVELRKSLWRRTLERLIDEVNPLYQANLARVGATGSVRLVNMEDIEGAGLELLVGYRGGEPLVLDAYTQSGGERTVALMAFLLSLQQHLRSPFRAVDEFDIHMDPLNRELMAKLIIDSAADSDAQYVFITPSQVVFSSEVANMILVQKVQGKSEVSVVS
ncbi:MAG: AAA family ATPase [Candidatus Hadarchaeales archaeon]